MEVVLYAVTTVSRINFQERVFSVWRLIGSIVHKLAPNSFQNSGLLCGVHRRFHERYSVGISLLALDLHIVPPLSHKRLLQNIPKIAVLDSLNVIMLETHLASAFGHLTAS
jgi:hypothetical protein